MKIQKINNDYPNRSKKNYEVGKTMDECQLIFDTIEFSYRNHGGSIVERTEDKLTVEEGDGSNNITYSIIEEND